MNVGDLIEVLKDMPLDCPVVLSLDVEGNGFAPLDAAEIGSYDPETCEAGILNLTKALEARGYSESDVKSETALVLWP